jgi:trafficking protein particle complex subunit 8
VNQVARYSFGASRWNRASDGQQTIDFVTRKLADVLKGKPLELSEPPPVDLLVSHISKVGSLGCRFMDSDGLFIE